MTLDGTIDWIVAKANALHTYSGQSLIVNAQRRSRYYRYGHTFLSGRGIVALTSNGPLYKLRLEQGETFLINRANLVAYSIDSNNSNTYKPELHRLNPRTADTKMVEHSSERGTSIVGKSWQYIKSFYTVMKNFLVTRSTPQFLKLQGPTTLIITSSPSLNDVHLSLPRENLNNVPLESQVSAVAQVILDARQEAKSQSRASGMTKAPSSHLKVATVQNGKVVFQSTENFNDFK